MDDTTEETDSEAIEIKDGIFGLREKQRHLTVIEALQQSDNRRMVLLGLPGTGKSTFLRYLSLLLARHLCGEAREIKEWDAEPILPLVISLGHFADSLPKDVKKGCSEHLESFIKETLAVDKRMSPYSPFLLEACRNHGGLFLFDGLDEVANLKLRPIVVEAIENFADIYNQNANSYFIVTCRTYSYQDKHWQLTQWPQHELALFTDEKIQQFVKLWYDQHILLDQKQAIDYANKREKLLAALSVYDRRRLREVARFPIILTVMAVVHASYELPDSRAQVYKQCVDILLEKWNAKRSIMGQERTRNILAELDVPRTRIDQALYEIAYEAHKGRVEDDASGGVITEKLVSGIMTEYLQSSEKVGIFLDYCRKANGLLMLRGTITSEGDREIPRRVYTFPHLTFEEYLAGRYLDGMGGDLVRELLDQAFDRWWEVTKFLAEYLCFESADRGRMNEIIEALSSPFPENPSDKDWRALWLAGELLTLYKRSFPKPSLFEPDIKNNLLRLLNDSALSPRERADAADVLDELGYLPPDLHTFVPIPNPHSPNFYIARYPVTNIQYQRFIEAEDFADKQYWMDFPKFSEPDEETNEIKQIGNWGSVGWNWLQKESPEGKVILPRYWDDPRFGIARAGVPVVGITWYEANAYCQWLLAHWEEQPEAEENPGWKPELVRLPTESEWIAAAGGNKPGRRFPWDRDGEVTDDEAEILKRANVDESGIGRTTPVGMYPLGASPQGVWDLAGNVFECQVNYYGWKLGDEETLALRGGSWNYYHNLARLSDRVNAPPGNQGYISGFRVAAFPSGRS